jgi:tRNA (guanosine-2'-O-)-methyltransferase
LSIPYSPETEEALLDYLFRFVTPERKDRMLQVVSSRTDFIRVVLEDIYQPHNASAVIRSCECFGISNLHVIENNYAYTVNRDVAMGASKWIQLNRHNSEQCNNSSACLDSLRKEGYRIVATSLDPDSVPIEELPIDQPIALCFGTEETGLSSFILQSADLKTHIPMYGFTQSFNISVSAALSLASLRQRLQPKFNEFALCEAQRRRTLLSWLRQSIPRAERIEKAFLEGK